MRVLEAAGQVSIQIPLPPEPVPVLGLHIPWRRAFPPFWTSYYNLSLMLPVCLSVTFCFHVSQCI